MGGGSGAGRLTVVSQQTKLPVAEIDCNKLNADRTIYRSYLAQEELDDH